MNNRLAVAALFVLDMLLTAISRKIYGNWNFEANPLLPGHLGKFASVTALDMAFCEDPTYRAASIKMRMVAVVGHPIYWVVFFLTGLRPDNKVCVAIRNFKVKYAWAFWVVGIAGMIHRYYTIKRRKETLNGTQQSKS